MRASELGCVKRIHFVGIGGAGMGGIAEVLYHQGYQVTGSDVSQNAMVQRLKALGVSIFPQHHADNVNDAHVVVVSTAISSENPEVVAAQQMRIPVIPRAQMLADLMRVKYGIAVAGTHGKTTTTSFISSLLSEAGLDPTFVIGGLLKSAGANAGLGQSHFFVAEADESDASFLYLYPQVAVVTNIDADHLSTYQGDFNRLRDTFVLFLHKLPFNGLAVLCYDDPIVREIIPRIQRPTVTYGFEPAADVCIKNYQPSGFQSNFVLSRLSDNHSVEITLNLPGVHNALNAAAAYAVAMQLGIADEVIQRAFQQFAGVGRRLQNYGELSLNQGKVLLIDDYGHHPREIMATWSAVRQAWPDRRLVVAYQPHRYTRTRDLFDEFVQVLSEQIDQLILLDIYPAGESPIPGADGVALFDAVRNRSKFSPVFVTNVEALLGMLPHVLKAGDILLTQGAGSIGGVAPQLAENGFVTA